MMQSFTFGFLVSNYAGPTVPTRFRWLGPWSAASLARPIAVGTVERCLASAVASLWRDKCEGDSGSATRSGREGSMTVGRKSRRAQGQPFWEIDSAPDLNLRVGGGNNRWSFTNESRCFEVSGAGRVTCHGSNPARYSQRF